MLTCGVGCLFASTALCTLAVKNVKKSDPGDEVVCTAQVPLWAFGSPDVSFAYACTGRTIRSIFGTSSSGGSSRAVVPPSFRYARPTSPEHASQKNLATRLSGSDAFQNGLLHPTRLLAPSSMRLLYVLERFARHRAGPNCWHHRDHRGRGVCVGRHRECIRGEPHSPLSNPPGSPEMRCDCSPERDGSLHGWPALHHQGP